MIFPLPRSFNSSAGTITWSVVLPSGHATTALSKTALQANEVPGLLLSFRHSLELYKPVLVPLQAGTDIASCILQYTVMETRLHWKSASIGTTVTSSGLHSASSTRRPRRNSLISLLLCAFCIGSFLWFNADQVSRLLQPFQALFDVLIEVVAERQPPDCLETSLKTSPALRGRCSVELDQCACTPSHHPRLQTKRKPLQINTVAERTALPSTNSAEYSTRE